MKPPILKLFIFLTFSTVLFSCSSSRFTSKRYGNRDWIKVDSKPMEKSYGDAPEKNPKDESISIPVTPEIRPELAKAEIITENKKPELTDQKSQNSDPATEKDPSDSEVANKKLKTTEGRLTMIEPPVIPMVKKLNRIIDASFPGDNTSSDANLILLVILAILIPPLGVYLYDGTSTMFWVTLILCLLGGPLWFYVPFVGGLWGIAIILAVLYVLGII